MGSRAVVVVCRDADAARARFGVETARPARSTPAPAGRSSTTRRETEAALAPRPRRRRRAPGSGTSSRPTGCVLDCELLPWSAKAIELIRRQYAAVGAAARAGLAAAIAALEHGGRDRGLDVAELLGTRARAARPRRRATSTPTGATCWPVDVVDDLRLAPFHVLAAEGGVFVDRDHAWHLEPAATAWSPPTRTGSRAPSRRVVDARPTRTASRRDRLVGAS